MRPNLLKQHGNPQIHVKPKLVVQRCSSWKQLNQDQYDDCVKIFCYSILFSWRLSDKFDRVLLRFKYSM